MIKKGSIKSKRDVVLNFYEAAMRYGSVCWIINKRDEIKMKVAVMRMISWMNGMNGLDGIRN